jgi:short-subunit dehydrogenase
LLIEKNKLPYQSLQNKTILITGAGGGIGFEAARSLAWMGINVVIAEINEEKGKHAEKMINEELKTQHAFFFHIDISNDEEVEKLYLFIKEKYGNLYGIINNAIVTYFGPVDKVDMVNWDKAYKVNLRAPIKLIQKFLPDMKKQGEGVIVFVPSSGASPYMGAYEVFKTSQVELGNTLVGELEGTNVYTYSIGPGLVKTETATKGIEQIARMMKITTEEFYTLNEKHILDAESTGVGFAVSLLNAKNYNGQEIGSIQALKDAGIYEDENTKKEMALNPEEITLIKKTLENIITTFDEQYEGWMKRNIFERQWVLRDFKKEVNYSASEFKSELDSFRNIPESNVNQVVNKKILFEKLKSYYLHQLKMMQQYEKSPQKVKENTVIINSWIDQLGIMVNIISK